MKSTLIIMCVLFLASCVSTGAPRIGLPQTTDLAMINTQNPPLTILSGVGGLCVIGGMCLLVVTSGKKGWYPVIAGIAMVILNYLVAKYDDILFYPLIFCTGLISIAWTYKTIKQILQEKKR